MLRQESADRIGASRVGRYVCRHRRAVTRFKRRRIGDLRLMSSPPSARHSPRYTAGTRKVHSNRSTARRRYQPGDHLRARTRPPLTAAADRLHSARASRAKLSAHGIHGQRSAHSAQPRTPSHTRPRPWLVRGRGFRPWPSVETDGYTDRPGGRTPSAIRPWTAQHSGPQRYEMTHGGTKKKRPAQPRIRS